MPRLVAIDLPGGPAFVDALRRAWEAGDAVLPVDQRIADAAKRRLFDALRPARVIDDVSDPNGAAYPDPLPTEPGDALVVATSGTTGNPKGVVLTHGAVRASAEATTARLGVDPGRHRWLACLPLNHVGGLSVVTRSLLTGTPVTVLPAFEPAATEAAAGPEVFVSLVATALRRTSAGCFHTVVLGGSPPPDDLPANVVTTYGLTETGSGVVYDGLPLDGVDIDTDPGTGEIRIRAPMLLRAYRDGKVPLDAGGWFATGDSGHVDGTGRLHVDGRLTDLIVTGGENVWPAPLEASLLTHPKVAEAAVAGAPDDEWGQRVVAFVVPKDPSDPPGLQELRDLISGEFAPFAAPKQLVLVDELPKTAIGKVRRDLLAPP